ncbi:hypothetical protein P171DRAFT_336228, partial [Karstenula rhodostoma CBS 690.94]
DATSSSARIRDNQRRSRMRRAELVESLQKRVQEHERQGVAATLEMQRAARKVAQDNMRLRALLVRHGVSNEQIEYFLRSPEESSTPDADPLSFQRPSVDVQHHASEKDRDASSCPAQSSYQTQNCSGLNISCEAAAAVIAGMRGDGDRDSIWASLGCRGQETCTVKNSTVFQIMDEG